MNFNQTEIGLIPEDWEVVRLGEVIEFTRKPRNLRIRADDEVPFIPMELIPDDGKYAMWKMKKHSEISSGTFVFKNDIIVAKITPSFENGKQALLTNLSTNFGYATTEVLAFHPKNEKVLREFIFEYLRISKIRCELASKMEGTTGRKRLPRNALENLKIPLPPLSEQQKIAKILDKIQEAIQIQDRIIEQARNLKKSLMQKLFTEGLYGEEQKETEIGLIPKSWKVIRFEEAILKKRVKVGKIKQQEYKKFGKYPVIDQSQNYIAGFSDDDQKVYNDPLPVIIFGDHTRIFKFVDFQFIVGADRVKILIPNTNIYDPRFLYFALLMLDIPSRGYNRHYPLLREKKIPLPPLSEQNKSPTF